MRFSPRAKTPAVILASVTVLMLCSAPAAAAPNSTNLGCDRAFDPYAEALSYDVACGDKVFPLQNIEHMPDGSTKYWYSIAGNTTVFTVPPAHFAYDAASDAQIATYGLPPRPKDSATLADWQLEMRHLTISPPPAQLIMAPAQSSNSSLNWSGYLAYSSSSTAYSFSEIRYNEPQALSTTCTNNSETTWTGLGGEYTGNLAQAGTYLNTPSFAQHQAYYEILPAGAVALQVYGHAGYGFYAEVNRIGGGFNFYVHDTYSGQGTQFQVYGTFGYDGRSAESIIERPSVNGSTRNLTNYSYINVLDAWVNGNSASNGIGNYPNFSFDMYDYENNLMATDSGLSNSGQTFTNYFKSCA